jgi:hypothetical protein
MSVWKPSSVPPTLMSSSGPIISEVVILSVAKDPRILLLPFLLL